MKRFLLSFLLALLACGAWAVDCTTGQDPYSVTGQGYTATGPQRWDACDAVAYLKDQGNRRHVTLKSSQTVCSWYKTNDTGSERTGAITQVCDPVTVYIPPTPFAEEELMTTCTGACTVTHVVDVQLPVLNLDAADGGLIAGAILAVWVVGWSFRMVIRALNSDGKPSTSESES